jgi:hypothetical protein
VGADGLVYVGGSFGPRVTVWRGEGTEPERSFGGMSANGDVTSLWLGDDGNVYVFEASARRIEVFPSDANGDDPPVRSIPLAISPLGGGVDDEGWLYVSGKLDGAEPDGQLLVFAPGANGNASADATLNTGGDGIAIAR